MVKLSYLAALASLTALAWPLVRPAHGAEPPPVALRLTVGDALSCPPEEALRAAVVERLGGLEPFRATARRRFGVAVRRAGSGVVARITLVEPDGRPGGTRRIVAPTLDCAALFDATALAVALAIDPTRARAALVEDRATAPAAAPPETTPHRRRDRGRRRATRSSRATW